MITRATQTIVLFSAITLLASQLVPTLFLPAMAEGTRPSRLSQLVKKKPSMYLPSRLIIGQDNRFTFQGTPGNQVRLYMSSSPEGFSTPDGQPLRVGAEHQEIAAEIPANGVLEIIVPLPAEEGLVGQNIFVEGIAWHAEDFSDLVIFEQIDASGRRATENYVAINKLVKNKGSIVMPTLPGMSPSFVQQLNTLSEITNSGDARKKELLDTGEINRDNTYDRNIFINRPGNMLTPR